MKSRRHLLALTAVLAVLILAITAGLAGAAEAKKPKFKVFHSLVGPKEALQVSEGQVPGFLIDSRPKVKKFDQGHIPGSINIPFSRFDKMTQLLPKDKSALIIFYCQGPT